MGLVSKAPAVQSLGYTAALHEDPVTSELSTATRGICKDLSHLFVKIRLRQMLNTSAKGKWL